MSENADLIFGVDTSRAVESLKRLDKALNETLQKLGEGSTAPFSLMKQNSQELSAATKNASVEFDELARKANEAAKTMVTVSRKIGDSYTSIRLAADASAEALKRWERAQEELANNPETVAGYLRQKKELKDLADYNERVQRQMTDAWHKELDRRNKLVAQKDKELENYNKAVQTNMTELYHQELHRRSEATRKENEKQLAYQRDLEQHMQSLTQRYWKQQADYAKNVHDNMTQAYVGELRRREQAEREHQNTMARLEREGWNRKKRMDSEKIAYLSRSSASQLQLLEEINFLSNQGVSTSALARRFGSFAVTQPRTEEAISALRKEVEAQRAVEAAERGLNKERSRGEPLKNRSTDAILRNNRAMHDARGLARGLTGALGQLWLTYGAVGPLLAGAAVGSIARQTYTVGKDVEYRLKMLEALGNRPINITEMMPAVHGSMKTPLEAAQGLQELAQAGLTAEQSLATLSTVLNIATLGELSVADAALTTTAALSTFNLEVGEAVRVGNVYAKTASVSNTNIQGIAEAMKQAGSAAAIYGVEIEAVAAQVAILAQNGIRGSAAGTAIRNAMTELHAPTKKAQEIMNDLGIEIYNSDKTSRNYIDVLGDLRQTYYTLNEESRNAMLKGMFNERSRRFIQIAIKDYDQLKKMIDKVTDSQGFLMAANLKLLDTVEGASNRMQSVLQQSLVEAFDVSRPEIVAAIRNMEQLFASDEFKRGVITLTKALADVTSYASEHAETILKVGAAYVAWKIALKPLLPAMVALAAPLKTIAQYGATAASAFGLITSSASKTAPAVTTVATGTATLASRLLAVGGAVVRFAGPLGLLVGTLATSYTLMNRYSSASSTAAGAQDTLSGEVDRVTKALDLQNEQIRENLKLRKLSEEGSSLEIYDTNKTLERVRADQQKHAEGYAKEMERISYLSQFVGNNRREMSREERLEYEKTHGVLASTSEASLKLQMHYAQKTAEGHRRALELRSSESLTIQERLNQSAETNLKQHIANIEDSIKGTLEGAKVVAEMNPDNPTIQKAYQELERLKEQYESNAISADEYKEKVEALNKEMNLGLASWTPPSASKEDRSMAKALERFEEWYAKQKLAITTLNQLTNAYLQGEEHLRKYHLEQEIGNVQIKDRTKHEKEIEAILKAKNRAEEINNIAKEAYELSKQTKTADEYVDVLLAQSKGYKEGEAALKKFNKEQALNALLSKTSAENSEELLEVIEKFNKEYDRGTASADRNKKLEKLNDLVDQSKNSTQRYREELERLEGLRLPDASPEQLAALDTAMAKVHQEYNPVISAMSSGIQALEQTSANMWKQFMTDGKITFDNISNWFTDMLAQMAHEIVTRPIFQMLHDTLFGTNQASGGGFLGSLVQSAIGAFTGSASAPDTSYAPDVSSFFSSGGYTGDGGKYEPAGIVHKGEGVLSKEDVEKIGGERGFNTLQSMIRSGGYANGGYVGSTKASAPLVPNMGPTTGVAGGNRQVNVTIYVDKDGSTQTDSPAGWEAFAKEIGDFVDSRIQKAELRGMRSGGLTWKAQRGQL